MSFDFEWDRRDVPALKCHEMVLGKDGADLFPAGVADMDFAVANPIQDAILERAKHPIYGYEAFPDALYLAIINWYQTRHQWQIDQNHILRSPNVLNALAIAASFFSNEGDGVIVQPPVFFDFFDIIKENKRDLVLNPLKFEDGRYEMDFDGLEKLASDPKNKILFLCNPHNPIGRAWDLHSLKRLGDICIKHDVLVVSDELHGDIVFKGHHYTPFASLGVQYAKHSIVLISPAKSFNIAANCSSFTVIVDDELREAFKRENSRLTVNKNNAFANVAMLAAYQEGGVWLNEVLEYLQNNLEMVRQKLSGTQVKLIEPEATFLLWLDFSALFDDPKKLTQFLRGKAGWAVARGEAFGEQGIGFARLNIACPKTRLEQALDQLIAAL